MSSVANLVCRSCEERFDKGALARCPKCEAPLDPSYDWDSIGSAVDRDALTDRPRTIWRYAELLPLDEPPTVSREVGWTPLVEAPQLARAFNVGRIWLKCDGYSFPSLSFKDRVVAVALNKALELGIRTVGCPSTGNLANAVAAHASAAGLEAWILVPESIEIGKMIGTAIYHPRLVRIGGTYDDANRLAAAAAERFGWGIVNVNLRAFYGEGSKTMAFETAEQLGWRAPDAVICPMAGGSLVTKLQQGFRELRGLGWIEGGEPRFFGAQASGCSPIVDAWRTKREIVPVKPDTIAHSIAIGNPVDGAWAVEAIRSSGGGAVAVADAELVEGIEILARTTGVFTETAGGVTVSACRALAADGTIGPEDEVVLCLTGNGMKTVEAVASSVTPAPLIEPRIEDLEALL